MNRMMIDLETLDTEPTAIVISAGIVVFDTVASNITFSEHFMLDMDHQLSKGRSISMSTIKWWLQQETNPIAPDIACIHYTDMLGIILETWKKHNIEEVWSCGSFDVDIINDMFDNTTYNQPWTHYCAVKDYRAVRDWFKDLVPFENPDSKHDALADAVAQVKHMQKLCGQVQASL